MSDPTDGVVWCTSDQPHKPHRRNNLFRGYDYCTGRPVPTTVAEPTVPVPRWFLEDLAAGRTSGRDEARTLLSQPTLTAEPVCGGAATNCNHRFWPPMHTMACPVGRAQNQPDAAPPRIANMVPESKGRGDESTSE